MEGAGISPIVKRFGFWSATLSSLFAIAYVLAQVAEWMGILGSRGGPESMSTPLGIALLLTPSLLLAPSFVVLMVSIHYAVPVERKIWSHLGFTFATAYAVLIGMVYFVQLTLVAPRLARGDTEDIKLLLFIPFDSFLYAVDILGYSIMSLATLFAAGAFPGGGLNGVIRWFLIANGLLIPFLVFQMYHHSLIYIAALWAVTFPGATLSLAFLFRRRIEIPRLP